MNRRPLPPLFGDTRTGAVAIALAAAFSGLAPMPAIAKSDGAVPALRLSGGEHGAFSRVVLHGGPKGGWSVLSGERRFDLRLPGGDLRIDADAVTRHRRAHRILAMRARREGEETVLSFSLDCDCAAKARQAGSGALIIDVAPRGESGGKTKSGRKAKEAEGAIETASTPKTAPLDVEGARAFLMEQLKRAAKQGLIRYREDAPASGEAKGPGGDGKAKPASAGADAAADRRSSAQKTAKAASAAKPQTAEHAVDQGALPGAPHGSAGDDYATNSGGGSSHHAAPSQAGAHGPAGDKAAKKADATDKAAQKQPHKPSQGDAPHAPAPHQQPKTAETQKAAGQGAEYDKESLKSFFSSQSRGTASKDAPQAEKHKSAHAASTGPKTAARGHEAHAPKPPHKPEAAASHKQAHASEAASSASGRPHHDDAHKRADASMRDDKSEHAPAKRARAKSEHAKNEHAKSEHAKSEHAEHHTADAASTQADAAPCPADDLLDPRNWPIDANYGESLSELRSALFDELNRIDPRAVAQLQLLYLANGFGQEAAAAPRGFKTEDADVALLAALGDVIARRKPEPGTPFNRAAPCPGRQAFWQAVALADSEPQRSLAAYRDSQRALWRTPTALRRLAGERIALAATRIGELQSAAEILAVLERSQLPPTPGLRVVRAELALADGRTVAAQSELEEVAHSRDENKLLAALKLAESFSRPYEAERALELADLLADFAMQRRGGEDMIKAITAEARLRARFGHLPEALTAIEVSRRYGGYAPERLEALRVSLLDESVASLGLPIEGGKRGFETGDAKSHLGSSRKRRSSKLDKKALALASQLVEQISQLPEGEENDRLRVDLARQLAALGAPHLAPLVIDDAFAARSSEATKARDEAKDAAALIDPLGALNPRSDALGSEEHPVDSALDSLISELEAAEALAIQRATNPEPEPKKNAEDDKYAAAMKRLRNAKGAPPRPAGTIEDGQNLLQGVDKDLDLLRSLTRKQRSAPAPSSAPHAADGEVNGQKAKGGVDG